jgi:hypothetical protein
MLGAAGVGELEPASVARVVSDLLYANNLLLSPIVAGLDQVPAPHMYKPTYSTE